MHQTKICSSVISCVAAGMVVLMMVRQTVPQNPIIVSPVQLEHLPNGIHLVMMFPLFETDVSKRLGYNISDLDLLKRRQEEFITTLKENSKQRIVTKTYLMNEQPEALRNQLKHVPNLDMDIIETVQCKHNPTYRELFQFASDKLQNKLIFIVNGDNSMGKGFDELDLTWWDTAPKVMYALTRHSPLKECKLGPGGYCDTNGTYVGSHDGYLFHLQQRLSSVFLKEIDFVSNSWGSDNVIIWVFRRILKFRVLNPCKRLFLHHNHCSNLRPTNIKRPPVNRKKNGMVYYSY